MRCPGFRLSVRSLLVAIALIGLDLAGVTAALKFYPIEQVHAEGDDFGQGAAVYVSDGSIYVYRNPGNGERLTVRIVYRRLPMIAMQVWSPALASAAITVLAIAVPLGFPVRRRTSSPDRETGPRGSRVRAAPRWAAIGAALIVLNLAGAAYRPPAVAGDLEISRKLSTLLDIVINETGDVYDAITESKVLIDHGKVHIIPPAGPQPRFPAILRGDGARRDSDAPDGASPRPVVTYSGAIKTVVFKEDGRILGYEEFPPDPRSHPRGFTPPKRSPLQLWFPILFEWNPVPVASAPYVIRGRLRAPLAMWSPLIGSASITFVVLGLLWHRSREHWAGPVSASFGGTRSRFDPESR